MRIRECDCFSFRSWLILARLANPDEDDLWDFGTVKNIARQSTITRLPPLPTESGRRSLRSKNSTGSVRRILNQAGTTPSTPSANNPGVAPTLSSEDVQEESEQGTLRYSGQGQRREATFVTDEPDKYVDENVDDTLTDATMLDSVVLPAIISVSPEGKGLYFLIS
jgi:serine/threonine-protein kinase 24/25/MST4